MKKKIILIAALAVVAVSGFAYAYNQQSKSCCATAGSCCTDACCTECACGDECTGTDCSCGCTCCK